MSTLRNNSGILGTVVAISLTLMFLTVLLYKFKVRMHDIHHLKRGFRGGHLKRLAKFHHHQKQLRHVDAGLNRRKQHHHHQQQHKNNDNERNVHDYEYENEVVREAPLSDRTKLSQILGVK